MGWQAVIISGGHSGGTEEGKVEDFTVFITLCRLNLLSLFHPWRVEKNNRGVLELFKSIPAIWGQQVMNVEPLKKKCSSHGFCTDNLLSFTLMISCDLKFQRILEVVVI